MCKYFQGGWYSGSNWSEGRWNNWDKKGKGDKWWRKDDDPYDEDPNDLSVLDVRKCRKCGHRWAYIRQGGCINMKCDLAAKHACKLHVTAR